MHLKARNSVQDNWVFKIHMQFSLLKCTLALISFTHVSNFAKISNASKCHLTGLRSKHMTYYFDQNKSATLVVSNYSTTQHAWNVNTKESIPIHFENNSYIFLVKFCTKYHKDLIYKGLFVYLTPKQPFCRTYRLILLDNSHSQKYVIVL